MYPKKSAIWPVHSLPETANKNQITLLLLLLLLLKMSSYIAQPNLLLASLKTGYNKSINSYIQPKTEQKRLLTVLGASLTSLHKILKMYTKLEYLYSDEEVYIWPPDQWREPIPEGNVVLLSKASTALYKQLGGGISSSWSGYSQKDTVWWIVIDHFHKGQGIWPHH